MDTSSSPIQDLTKIIEAEARDLLQGAAEDMHRFAVQISADMIRAQTLPPIARDHFLRELRAQLRAVAEINRIRAEAAGWRTFERIVVAVSAVLLKVAVL